MTATKQQKIDSDAYTHDWLFLQLGNCCDWCARTNQEARLELEHILPKLRFSPKSHNTFREAMRDFEAGEPLRLLCFQCHKISHALRA